MRATLVPMLLIPAALLGQSTVAPTNEPVGPARGETVGTYNVVHSFETGYRFRTVGGNYGKYRSDVNFGNGVRLLSSSLTVNSKEGHGSFFDEIVLTTQGLGNDPYQSATFRIQKNSLFRYDLLWRLDEYYNPALPVSFGQHLMDTRRRLQDHDLTFFPQSKIRFFLGYSRNSQSGPALSTVQEFGARQNEFPIFADIRRLDNEYRVGGDLELLGARFHWLHGWDDFKEDTPYSLPAPSTGNVPAGQIVLNSFNRVEPYHGTSPYWRLSLAKEKKLWAVGARFAYVTGSRDFAMNELALGTGRFGAANSRQILISGDAKRPVSSGNLTLSLFPAAGLTITNQTAFHNTRISGESVYNEISNGFAFGETLFFEFLGIRTITNLTDVNYRPVKWLGLYGGYHYSTRRFRSVDGFSFPGSVQRDSFEQQNHTHAGLTGIRLQLAKRLTMNLDGEIDRSDRPFYPISDRNYHSLGWRLQYKTKTLLLSAASRANYNTNSASFYLFSSQARNHSANATWTPKTWFALDLGYAKIHLNTISGIAYFLNAQPVRNDRSLYFSNIHSGTAGAHFGIRKRADVYVGYSRVQDTGDGRSNLFGAGIGTSLPALQAAQTFPLSFESPQVRLSVRLRGKLRWNLGYQHYRYREEFYRDQNYRANTGYSSVLWSF